MWVRTRNVQLALTRPLPEPTCFFPALRETEIRPPQRVPLGLTTRPCAVHTFPRHDTLRVTRRGERRPSPRRRAGGAGPNGLFGKKGLLAGF